MNFTQSFFLFYYSDILGKKKNEERHFHSTQREAWPQRRQIKCSTSPLT